MTRLRSSFYVFGSEDFILPVPRDLSRVEELRLLQSAALSISVSARVPVAFSGLSATANASFVRLLGDSYVSHITSMERKNRYQLILTAKRHVIRHVLARSGEEWASAHPKMNWHRGSASKDGLAAN